MRKVALGLALSGVLATQAHAVGLGEIRTHSALNQPLSANIELVETSAGDIDDIQVALAPREVFEQVGISRSRLLDQLEFIPTIENGVPTIKVVSLQPIQEPFLNFVLEVTWGNGKLLREYTVLLDPPVFSDTQFAGGSVPMTADPAIMSEPMMVEELPATDMAVLPPVMESYPVMTESLPAISETEMLAGGVDPFVSVPDAVAFEPGAPMAESEAFMYEGLETYPVENIAELPDPVVLSEADIAAELSQPLPDAGFDPFMPGSALPDADMLGVESVAAAPAYQDYPLEETFAVEDQAVEFAGAGTEQIFIAQSELTPAEAEIESIFTESGAPAFAAAPTAPASGGDAYRVRRGDTLSRIARQIGQPGALNKTMVALLRENPSAFINNNMNLVRAGYILRIPDAQTIEGISEREALSTIAAQNSAWRQYRSSVASVATPQFDSSGFAGIADLENRIPAELGAGAIVRDDDLATEEMATESVASMAGGLAGVDDLIKPPSELKILVPDGKGDSIEGDDSTGTGAIGNLEGQLSFAKEQLESQTQQNAELRSRVGELESLLESKNRLIELKNEQLSDFQEKLSDAAVDVTDATQSVVTEAKELAGSAASSVTDTAKGLLPKTEVADTTETSEPAEQGGTTAITEQKDASKPMAEEEPGMFDALKNNPNLLMGAGFGGLLLAALGWLLLRRKDEDNSEDTYTNTIDAAAPTAAAPVLKDATQPEAVKKDDADSILAVDNELEDLDDVDADTISLEDDLAEIENVAALPADSGMEATEDGGDEDEVMSEANVYLAYGLQDQAIDLLKPVVESHPDRTDYAVKLAEAYHAAGDRQSFGELSERLKGKIDPDGPEWKKISGWGKELLPDNSLFSSVGGAAAGAAAAGAAALGGISSAIGSAKDAVSDRLSDADDGLDEIDELISENDLTDLSENAADELEDIDLSELDDFEVGLSTEKPDVDATQEDISPAGLVSEADIDLDDITLDDQDEVLATSEIEDVLVGLDPSSTMALEVEDDLDLDTLVGDDDGLSVFGTGEDEVSTKLDLAKAYLDMGDDEGAREALDEVINIGNDSQRSEAMKLKGQLDT